MAKPRVGIVGISGYYAFSFAEALWTNHDVDFAAASTWPPEEERGIEGIRMMTPTEYGERFGVKMYDDPLTMISRESLDGVSLCGHAMDHLPMVEAIAPTGVSLFFDKPVALTLDETDQIASLIRKHGNKSGACQPARYEDTIRQAKAYVDDGGIGDLLTVRAFLSHSGIRSETIVPVPRPDVHFAYYTADLTQWFMDWTPPKSAFAIYAKLVPEDLQPTDNAKGIVEFEDGRIGSMDLYCTPLWGGPLFEIEAIGTNGFVRTSQSVGRGTLFTKEGNTAFQADQDDIRRVHFNELNAWVSAVARGEDCELSVELARKVMELCVAWKLSSDERRTVHFPLTSSTVRIGP
ncbi:MAG: Gfo/Idh/MocA family oxidoreductase [Chloroflexi bacterium]|nr:Gfo/Idh/MocA family oxidoreductase [Chloroflexota bacterium]MCY3938678.1 Gfo/Idh/MocA family oxidoreductase [Chloroflexota bacterium]